MLRIFCSAAYRAASAAPLRRNLLGVLGLTVAFTLGPDGAVGFRPACAALIIHAPDGHAVVPPGGDSVPDPDSPVFGESLGDPAAGLPEIAAPEPADGTPLAAPTMNEAPDPAGVRVTSDLRARLA